MNARRVAILVVVFCGTIAGLAWWRGDWVLAQRRVNAAPADPPRSYSAAECTRYCIAAMLPLTGVTASTSDTALRQRITSQYGTSAAASLMRERERARVIVGQGKLFFPTRELCEQKNLSGECSELCRRYTELR